MMIDIKYINYVPFVFINISTGTARSIYRGMHNGIFAIVL